MAGVLPAIDLFGLKGRDAWIALAAGGVAGLIVLDRITPSLLGAGSGAKPQTSASDTANMLAAFAKSIAATGGDVAKAALGPGASLGAAGVNAGAELGDSALSLAGRVTDTLGGVARSATTALADTNRSLASVIEVVATRSAPTAIGAPVSQPVTPATPPASLVAPITRPTSSITTPVVTPSAPATAILGKTAGELAATPGSGYTQTSPTNVAVALPGGVTGGVNPANKVIAVVNGQAIYA